MVDFSHLEQLDVTKDRTAEFTLHSIEVNGVSPTIIVAPATEANKAYFNALLKRAGRSARQVAAGKINAGMIQENREEDRALYPAHIIQGWKDMLDADGSEVEFSRENCADFLNALPGWLFDDLRNFCGKPENFVSGPNVDVVQTGKN